MDLVWHIYGLTEYFPVAFDSFRESLKPQVDHASVKVVGRYLQWVCSVHHRGDWVLYDSKCVLQTPSFEAEHSKLRV